MGDMNPNSVFGSASRVPTVSEILAAYGIAEGYMPQSLLFKLQCAQHTNKITNEVEDIMHRAQDVYRREVDARRKDQLRKHCETTGEQAESLSNLTLRKLTNRATAGAGKTRYQFLLKNLEECARRLSQEENEIASFFYQVLKQNYYHVVSGRAAMINAPDDMGNTIDVDGLESTSHFQKQLRIYRIVIFALLTILFFTIPLALRCRSS